MPTPQTCRENAEEAERLADLVSYERDRTQLTQQAQEWRARADALEASALAMEAEDHAAGAGWLRRLLARVGL